MSFCANLVIPHTAIEAARKARYNALMGPCCFEPLEMESAIAAALETWGFEMESNETGNRLVGPWMNPEHLN